ncbi:AAA family ATPase [Longimicrobium sp.]|uniref:AAA family ATPase n=1 Tax=Longimicrobium sp. TaxID=2029185 RepID=UPI002E32AF20|nr:AAA family ATPase [Longimicrobium sp.]HEX6039765.1 AAA family ATPase [Longimicrobium sp.]
MEMPAVLVVTGASGAGKTTLVRALQAGAPAGIVGRHFDDIGVPSVEEMVREHGSGDAWQRAMTHRWMRMLRDLDVSAVVLDAQVRPSFVREAFEAEGVRCGGIVLVDCDAHVRRARLIERGQPELATPQMDQWAAYLRGQADALGLPVLDTTDLSVEQGVGRLREIIDALLAEPMDMG